MLKFDYELKRSSPIDQIFTPDINKNLDNLVSITGPSDRGKSTLLNIIAYGFFYDSNKKISDDLKNKIKKLDSNRQSIQFKIEISNKDGSLILCSEKQIGKAPEVYELRDGKKINLSKELFMKKYNLMYDIPGNQLRRLIELIKEVEDFIGDFIKNTDGFATYLGQLKDELSGGEKKLKDYKSQVESLTKSITEIESELQSEDGFNRFLHEFYLYKAHEELKAKDTRLIDEKKSLLLKKEKSGRIQQTAKRSRSKLTESIDSNEREMRELVEETLSLLEGLNKKTLEKCISRLKVIQSGLNQDLPHYKVPKDIDQLCKDCKTVLERIEKENEQGEQAQIEIDLYKNLIDILNNYQRMVLSLPKINITIMEFIKELNDGIDKRKPQVYVLENISNSYEKLDRLRIVSDDLEKKFKEIGTPERSELEDIYSEEYYIQNRLNEINASKAKIEEEQKEIESDFKRYGEPSLEKIMSQYENFYNTYQSYTINQLAEEVKKHDARMEKRRIEKDQKVGALGVYRAELEKSEKTQESEYEGELDSIELFRNEAWGIGKSLHAFQDFTSELKDCIGKNITLIPSSTNQNYNAIISNFLGKKIGQIQLMDKIYKVKSLDFIENVIITDQNERIFLDELGTGHIQESYIRGITENANDDKILIALFDEVGNMDISTQNKLWDTFNVMFEKNKLLLAIMVSPTTEELKTTSKIK